ncbi:MAG: STAS domain-containing protein [Bacilli bacterium]|nr:STAS domain-containing protein [Bacilli bacterium]
MLHELKDNKLIIYLEGELNSSNSEEVEQEIDGYLASGGFTGIILDFNNLKYISSAGLRIIARIKQNYDDLLLDKMSSDVYEIFEMVGFTDMIEIHRK